MQSLFEENSNYNKKIDVNNKLLGEGSYGCTFKPGLNCKGTKNLNKSTVNKITIIDFHSKNELYISNLIKKIVNYKKRFAPIIKSCIIKFNKVYNSNLSINNCENLLENYNYQTENNFINNNFFMFYSKYVHGGVSIKKYLLGIDNLDLYAKEYVYSLYYLLNSIYLLQNNNIIHNDMQNHNNILYNTKSKRPIIIDYGLTYNLKKFYKKDKTFDIKYINKFFFDFRDDHYPYNIEKRFIAFCINNHSENFYSKVNNDFETNKLIANSINYFVKDSIKSLYNSDIAVFFTDKDFEEYGNSIENFYKKFLNKNDYPTYFNIINELINYVFEYNDLYSLSIILLSIHIQKLKNDSFFNLINQLLKKNLFPDPKYRINTYQFISILQYLIRFINKNNEYNDEYYNKFIYGFNKLLEKINLNTEVFFYKGYSFVDFKKFINKDNIKLIKKLNLKI